MTMFPNEVGDFLTSFASCEIRQTVLNGDDGKCQISECTVDMDLTATPNSNTDLCEPYPRLVNVADHRYGNYRSLTGEASSRLSTSKSQADQRGTV